jgi:hypothetical protein
LAKPPKKGVGINTCIVTITPGKLQSIPPDRLHILQHDQEWHIIRLQTPSTGPLVYAGCAGTLLAEIPDRIDGLVPIIPFDTQHTLLNPCHVSRFTHRLCHFSEFPSTINLNSFSLKTFSLSRTSRVHFL